MPSRVHLVRHAESLHNVSQDFSTPDPPLTALGFEQARQLVSSFTEASSVAVVLTSPLKRAVQTALNGFPHVLDRSNYPPRSPRDDNDGVEGGVKLTVDPDLQERSDLPCDTGSGRAELEATFPGVDFSILGDNWHAKEGPYSAADAAVEARAKGVRGRLLAIATELADEKRQDIIVVTHGVFMKFLSGDPDINLPKAGWASYVLGRSDAGEIILTRAA